MKKTTLILGLTAFLGCMSGYTHAVAAASDTDETVQVTAQMDAGSAISLNSAPAFDFGTKTVDTDGATYPAESGQDTPLGITNPGTKTGWRVTATLGEFETNRLVPTADHIKLAGAKMILTPNQNYKGSDEASKTITDKVLWTTNDNTSTGSTLPTAGKVTLVAGGGEEVLFSANAGAGVGVWQTAFNAQLVVPAGNVEGNYSADLTWSLVNVPTP